MPGSIGAILGTQASNEQVRALITQVGEDLPWWRRYTRFAQTMGFDRHSLVYHVPVSQIILPSWYNTLELSLISILIMIVLGIAIGTSNVTIALPIITMLTYSLPLFFVAFLILWAYPFLFQSMWVAGCIVGVIQACILGPCIRQEIIKTKQAEFIMGTYLRDVSSSVRLYRHILPHALANISGMIGLQVAFIISGVVMVESIFNINGVGRLLLHAIAGHDIFVIRSLMMLLATLSISSKALTELFFSFLAPHAYRYDIS